MVLLIIIPIKWLFHWMAISLDGYFIGWLFHWEYTLFSDKPISEMILGNETGSCWFGSQVGLWWTLFVRAKLQTFQTAPAKHTIYYNQRVFL